MQADVCAPESSSWYTDDRLDLMPWVTAFIPDATEEELEGVWCEAADRLGPSWEGAPREGPEKPHAAVEAELGLR